MSPAAQLPRRLVALAFSVALLVPAFLGDPAPAAAKRSSDDQLERMTPIAQAMMDMVGGTGESYIAFAAMSGWESGWDPKGTNGNAFGLTDDSARHFVNGEQQCWLKRENAGHPERELDAMRFSANGQTGWWKGGNSTERHCFASFATVEGGSRASAGLLLDAYPKIVAAAQTGDALATIKAIECSRWNSSRYGASCGRPYRGGGLYTLVRGWLGEEVSASTVSFIEPAPGKERETSSGEFELQWRENPAPGKTIKTRKLQILTGAMPADGDCRRAEYAPKASVKNVGAGSYRLSDLTPVTCYNFTLQIDDGDGPLKFTSGTLRSIGSFYGFSGTAGPRVDWVTPTSPVTTWKPGRHTVEWKTIPIAGVKIKSRVLTHYIYRLAPSDNGICPPADPQTLSPYEGTWSRSLNSDKFALKFFPGTACELFGVKVVDKLNRAGFGNSAPILMPKAGEELTATPKPGKTKTPRATKTPRVTKPPVSDAPPLVTPKPTKAPRTPRPTKPAAVVVPKIKLSFRTPAGTGRKAYLPGPYKVTWRVSGTGKEAIARFRLTDHFADKMGPDCSIERTPRVFRGTNGPWEFRPTDLNFQDVYKPGDNCDYYTIEALDASGAVLASADSGVIYVSKTIGTAKGKAY